jgi:hypothetical protein
MKPLPCPGRSWWLLYGSLFVISVLLASPVTWAQAANQINAPFFAALEGYQHGNSEAARQNLKSTLEARWQTLSALMSSNPGLVLASALPDDMPGAVPAGSRGLLERNVTLQGKAVVSVAEMRGTPHTAVIQYGLIVGGKRLELHFAGTKPGNWLTDTTVKLSGVQLGSDVALTADHASVVERGNQ